MAKALMVFSGGQDSTTCLGWALNRFEAVETITFDYGQRHIVELQQAKKIAGLLGVKNTVFLLNIFENLAASSLIEKDSDLNKPHEKKPNLPSSYVPNRNALMFTIAHAYAQKLGFDSLVTGVCESDYSGYPDCREAFVLSLEKALNLGSDEQIKFFYPLMKLDKADTFALAKQEGVLDAVVAYSHTCYNGDREHRHVWGYGCGECPACRLRSRGWEIYEQRTQEGYYDDQKDL